MPGRRRRRTIRAQAASEDGIADATAPSEPTSEALLHLPTEFVHPTGSSEHATRARLALFRYIGAFYNPLRQHSSLGMLSPDEYENHYWKEAATAVAA
jgi:transposase InsO family protein